MSVGNLDSWQPADVYINAAVLSNAGLYYGIYVVEGKQTYRFRIVVNWLDDDRTVQGLPSGPSSPICPFAVLSGQYSFILRDYNTTVFTSVRLSGPRAISALAYLIQDLCRPYRRRRWPI